jgi:hypothetical protein
VVPGDRRWPDGPGWSGGVPGSDGRGRGVAGMPGWLDSAPTLTAEQTRLTDVHLVGNYALSPHWGDGHSTGFYPFVLLRHQCPCPVCAAERASAGGHGGG